MVAAVVERPPLCLGSAFQVKGRAAHGALAPGTAEQTGGAGGRVRRASKQEDSRRRQLHYKGMFA